MPRINNNKTENTISAEIKKYIDKKYGLGKTKEICGKQTGGANKSVIYYFKIGCPACEGFDDDWNKLKKDYLNNLEPVLLSLKENYKYSYNFKQIKAGVKFLTINNYTYLTDSIRPAQLTKAETVMQFFAEGTIPIKKFGINTRIVYQTTSQPNTIRFPDLTGVMDIYFRTQIFKKAGTIQTGFQVTYFSEYYADAYMPSLRLFHIQNEKKIGNYPYLDVYLTLMVKSARMFVKMSHFNSYFGNYNYYLAPNYPARDARFSFGVSWRFHD